jgi:hypothetical protein
LKNSNFGVDHNSAARTTVVSSTSQAWVAEHAMLEDQHSQSKPEC